MKKVVLMLSVFMLSNSAFAATKLNCKMNINGAGAAPKEFSKELDQQGFAMIEQNIANYEFTANTFESEVRVELMANKDTKTMITAAGKKAVLLETSIAYASCYLR